VHIGDERQSRPETLNRSRRAPLRRRIGEFFVHGIPLSADRKFELHWRIDGGLLATILDHFTGVA
jgi:hypothetical protein